jgi:hypothetical protein
MAWFSNNYQCDRCDGEWTDEWSSMCDDDCPICGAKHMSPCRSDDLTEIVVRQANLFVVFRSSALAEHAPDYKQIASFPTRKLAEAYMQAVIRDG